MRALRDDAVDLIASVIAPSAAATEHVGVPRATIDALARAGLLGAGLDRADMRELGEVLAGADATTWFCWTQHQTPMRTLAGDVAGLREGAPEELRSRLLPGLQSGKLLGAVAFAHVRRPGPANPAATRVAGGWRLDGTLDWVTSWDIADVVLVMAQGAPPDERALVCCYLPAGASSDAIPGIAVGEPLNLLAMSGTHTRPVALEGVLVPDAAVGAVLDRAAWLAEDARRTVDASPAAFGVARGAIAHLSSLAQRRDDHLLAASADHLAEACRSVRTRAYAAADADDDPSRRVRLRAESLDLALRAATAAVTAMAGAAMVRDNPAERRLREAAFLLVQAQTRVTRTAFLDRIVPGGAERG